ncbi:MAG: hypothetical protein ACOYMN_26020 [Roseimicrobium sp.]
MADEHRKMIALRLPPELIERLDTWCADQKPVVTKTATIELAIRQFLDERERSKLKPRR